MSASCDTLHESEIEAGLKLCSKMLARVMPSIVPATRDDAENQSEELLSDEEDTSAKLESQVKHETNEQDKDKQKCDKQEVESGEKAADEDASEGDKQEAKDKGVAADNIEDIEQAEDALESDKISQDFSEFVQFDSESTLPKIKISPMKSPRKKDLSEMVPQTLMQACLHSYQDLFVVFVTKKMLLDPDAYQILLQQLLTQSYPNKNQEYQRCSPLNSSDWCSGISPSQDNSSLTVSRMSLNHLSPGLCGAFAVACQLLVDFSCFPMYCTGHTQVPKSGSLRGKNSEFYKGSKI